MNPDTQIKETYLIMAFLENLRREMNNQNLGYMKLAQKTGFSKTYINHVFRMDQRPSFYFVVACSKALNISLEKIIKEGN